MLNLLLEINKTNVNLNLPVNEDDILNNTNSGRSECNNILNLNAILMMGHIILFTRYLYIVELISKWVV